MTISNDDENRKMADRNGGGDGDGDESRMTKKETTSTTAAAATSTASTITATSTPLVLEAKPLDPTSTDIRGVTHDPSIPSVSAAAVLGESESMPEGTPQVKGYDFNEGTDLDSMMESFLTTGFQATNLGRAVNEIRRMRRWRLSDVPLPCGNPQHDSVTDPTVRSRVRSKIFLGYTSNQISCGQREVIRYLVEHSMVDVVVTTAGGIEEDLIKCFHPTYVGTFDHNGRELRRKGINRIGNLRLPNSSYCQFEDWFAPILNRMHDEQDEAMARHCRRTYPTTATANDGGGGGEEGEGEEEVEPVRFLWTPSKMIKRLGTEINDKSSVLYWAAKNSIPIFCPALTDGSIGDMMYFHSYKRPGFVLDIAADVRRINDEAVRSYSTGMVIIGGGVVKHHVCNANLMRNGADYAVFVNTAQEYDGSDAGADPDEAVSWGKIRVTAEPVKVCAEASIVFPLLVSQTFAKDVDEWREGTRGCMCWIDDDDEVVD